jgi:hypothetical protein
LKNWAHFNISSSEECSLPIFNYSVRNFSSFFSLYIITCVVFYSKRIRSYNMLPKSNILYKMPFIIMFFTIRSSFHLRRSYRITSSI